MMDYWLFFLGFDDPGVGMVDHAHQGAEDVVVFAVEVGGQVAVHIAALDGEFEPDLGFGGFGFGIGELADKGGLIAPLTPGFGNIGSYCSRGADLSTSRFPLSENFW